MRPPEPRWLLFLRLIRLDKPIGILLLLWPTLWGLWIAPEGKPAPVVLRVFIAGTGQYGDMVEIGMLDSTKVTSFALQNAAPVASLMLATGAMVAELQKNDTPRMPSGGMGGMGI